MGFVLDRSTISRSADAFDDADKEELVGIIVAATGDITDASQITDLEVSDVVAQRRSLLDDAATGDVNVLFRATVKVVAGSDSAATADALKLSLKDAITSGALGDQLSEAIGTALVGGTASVRVDSSLTAIDSFTFVEVTILAETPAVDPCSSDSDCPSGKCAFVGRRALKGGGAFPRMGVCENA